MNDALFALDLLSDDDIQLGGASAALGHPAALRHRAMPPLRPKGGRAMAI
jgi:hypothetical protein